MGQTKAQESRRGKPSGAGKRKGKFARYFANTAAKKLRKVAKHNGPNALKAYKAWVFERTVQGNAHAQLVLPKERAA